MSEFSGKCDFADHIEIFGVESTLRSEIYVGKSKVPLEVHSKEDLVPYYPFVIAMSYSNEGCSKIFLTEKSWVDIEEDKYGKLGIYNYFREALVNEMVKNGYDEDYAKKWVYLEAEKHAGN